jgi:RecJ-like exonuclease
MYKHEKKVVHKDTDNPYELWREACHMAWNDVDISDFEDTGNVAIESAKNLLALAYRLKGVVCKKCQGRGEVAYGSTATWRGGIGGRAITNDVCDRCWGTGRSDKSGVDLRKVSNA